MSMPTTDQIIQTAGQHLARGQRDQAVSLLTAAVAQDPRHGVANQHLGLLLAQGGDFPAAIRHLTVAAAAIPGDAGLRCNLGMLQSSTGDMEAAEANFRAAIGLNPRYVDAQACLGMLLANRQRAAEAEAALAAALALAPGRSDVVYAYARLLTETGRAEESVAAIRAAQRTNLRDAFLQDKLCMMLNYVSDVSDEELLREHVRYGELAPRPDGDFSGIDKNPDRRLRIGYLSADLRQHSVAYYLEALLEGHDRRGFEVVCYHVGAGDEMTPRLKAKADLWRPLFPSTDDALLRAIREDRVDILVELAGHTSSNRLPVVARRAAPVQVTYIGYPNTTGVPSIAYRIVDSITDPPESDRWATERLVRIDPCFLCYRPPEDAPTPSQPPCAATGRVTFGSFNNLAKISPAAVELWSRIMRDVPGSRLVLKGKALADPAIATRFLARFSAQGISPERLEFLSHTPSTREHLAAYARVDIALDPFPYAGTTTTCEALWMGVPVVTLAGQRHASRVGLSLHTAIGLPDLVADTPERYHAIAAGLAADPPRLVELRRTLRERISSSPICDARRFVPKLEAAYRSMWRAWCAGR